MVWSFKSALIYEKVADPWIRGTKSCYHCLQDSIVFSNLSQIFVCRQSNVRPSLREWLNVWPSKAFQLDIASVVSIAVVPNLFGCIPPFAYVGTFHSSPLELSFLPCLGWQASINYN